MRLRRSTQAEGLNCQVNYDKQPRRKYKKIHVKLRIFKRLMFRGIHKRKYVKITHVCAYSAVLQRNDCVVFLVAPV